MTKAHEECITRVWDTLLKQDELVGDDRPVAGDPNYEEYRDNAVIISACPAARFIWRMRNKSAQAMMQMVPTTCVLFAMMI